MRIFLTTVACALVLGAYSQDYEKEFAHDLTQDAHVFTFNTMQTMNTILHSLGYRTDLNPNPRTVVTPGFACHAYQTVVDLGRAFLRGSGDAVANGLIGVLGPSFVSAHTSQDMADAIMGNFSSTFPDAARTVAHSVPNFDGGHGSGFGFELFCNKELLMTFGGGGGGGVTVSDNLLTSNFGGGGGGQTGNGSSPDTIDVGGGTGCNTGGDLKPHCHATADGGGSGFAKFLTPVKNALQKCNSPVICSGGGGGGGFSISSGLSSCGFGGSYTYQASAHVVPLNSPRNPDARNEPVECPGSKAQREDLAVAIASDVCTSACVNKPNFYSKCYCPCFKGKIEGLGLSWGFAMECNTAEQFRLFIHIFDSFIA